MPLIEKAMRFAADENNSEAARDRSRHLMLQLWLQVGEDYAKLPAGPNNLMTSPPTGAIVSIHLEEKMNDLERFFTDIVQT